MVVLGRCKCSADCLTGFKDDIITGRVTHRSCEKQMELFNLTGSNKCRIGCHRSAGRYSSAVRWFPVLQSYCRQTGGKKGGHHDAWLKIWVWLGVRYVLSSKVEPFYHIQLDKWASVIELDANEFIRKSFVGAFTQESRYSWKASSFRKTFDRGRIIDKERILMTLI